MCEIKLFLNKVAGNCIMFKTRQIKNVDLTNRFSYEHVNYNDNEFV